MPLRCARGRLRAPCGQSQRLFWIKFSVRLLWYAESHPGKDGVAGRSQQYTLRLANNAPLGSPRTKVLTNIAGEHLTSTKQQYSPLPLQTLSAYSFLE